MGVVVAKGGTLPEPDPQSIVLTSSGVTLGIQGYAAANVLRSIGF
jgi:hypothetical protein